MSDDVQPRFPIYIPSKSRADSRYTQRALELLGVIDYHVIVEEPQLATYAAAMGDRADRLLVLDPAFQDAYDTFDALGRSKSLGPGPARNMAWQHSIDRGFAWHWVIDDNVSSFIVGGSNRKRPAINAAFFAAMEDFVLQYRNVAMAGPNYTFFAKARQNLPPFVTGTRIYSCNLIRNDLPQRWRGRYNEDTDLSLRMLKDGWATVQFNAFLQSKKATQTVRGGNTEAFYSKEGTLAKSQMLIDMHPDVTRLVWKFGRPHHTVDYSRWRGQPLIVDPDAPPRRRFVIAADS